LDPVEMHKVGKIANAGRSDLTGFAADFARVPGPNSAWARRDWASNMRVNALMAFLPTLH